MIRDKIIASFGVIYSILYIIALILSLFIGVGLGTGCIALICLFRRIIPIICLFLLCPTLILFLISIVTIRSIKNITKSFIYGLTCWIISITSSLLILVNNWDYFFSHNVHFLVISQIIVFILLMDVGIFLSLRIWKHLRIKEPERAKSVDKNLFTGGLVTAFGALIIVIGIYYYMIFRDYFSSGFIEPKDIALDITVLGFIVLFVGIPLLVRDVYRYKKEV